MIEIQNASYEEYKDWEDILTAGSLLTLEETVVSEAEDRFRKALVFELGDQTVSLWGPWVTQDEKDRGQGRLII